MSGQMQLETIPGAIKAARLERWWTQEDLAKVSGVSVPTLNRLERENPPGVRKETLMRLAKALKVRPEDLARVVERVQDGRQELAQETNASAMAVMNQKMGGAERHSFAVQAIREQHTFEAFNAEDHASKLSDHIRAIDEEIEALQRERARLRDECVKATESMSMAREKFLSVAHDEYRDTPKTTRPGGPGANY